MVILRLCDVDVRDKKVFIRADLNARKTMPAASPTTRAFERRFPASAMRWRAEPR